MNNEKQQKNGYVYRCQLPCPIHKHCFIIKTEKPIMESMIILYKCIAQNRDIRLCIGGERAP